MFEVIKVPFVNPTQDVRTGTRLYFEAVMIRSPKPLTIRFVHKGQPQSNVMQLYGGVKFIGIYDSIRITTRKAEVGTDQVGWVMWADAPIDYTPGIEVDSIHKFTVTSSSYEHDILVPDSQCLYKFYSPDTEASAFLGERAPDVWTPVKHEIRFYASYSHTVVSAIPGRLDFPAIVGAQPKPLEQQAMVLYPAVKRNWDRDNLISAKLGSPQLIFMIGDLDFQNEYFQVRDGADWFTWFFKKQVKALSHITIRKWPAPWAGATLREQRGTVITTYRLMRSLPWS